MKFGINHWTFPSDRPLRQAFGMAREAGCDHIEVNLAEEGELSLGSSEQEVRSLSLAAKAAGIEISSLSSGLYWQYSSTSPDPSVRSRSLEILKRQITVAHWLGVNTVLVVPGNVTPEVQDDVAWNRASEFIHAALPTARQFGVCLAIENVWNRFLLSPLEMKQFVDSFQDPLVGVYFDAGNVLSYGYPQHWVRILGTRIRRIHVKDFDDKAGGLGGFRNLFNGRVPWESVRIALKEIGYDGYITAEVDGYPEYPELGLKHIVECMRTALG